MHEAVIVDDVVLYEERNQLFAGVPGWCCVAFWRFTSEVGQNLYRFCEDILLLFGRELGDVFVGVAVETTIYF